MFDSTIYNLSQAYSLSSLASIVFAASDLRAEDYNVRKKTREGNHLKLSDEQDCHCACR
jgi:hypothetical protein